MAEAPSPGVQGLRSLDVNNYTVMDIETTGAYPWLHELVAVGIGDTVHKGASHGSDAAMVETARLLSCPGVVVAHTNYDLRWMVLAGCSLAEGVQFHDTKVMAFMLDQSQQGDLGLDVLCQRYLGLPKLHKPIRERSGIIMYDCSQAVLEEYRDLGLIPIEDVPWPEMEAYNGQDLRNTAMLYEFLRGELRDNGMWQKFFMTEEAPLSKILVEMEVAGMPLDAEGNQKFLDKADAERQYLAKELVDETGVLDFNLRSGDKVADFIYDELPTFKLEVELPGLQSLGGPKHLEKRFALAASMLPASVKLDRVGTKYAYGHQTVDGLGLQPPKMKGKKGKEAKRPGIDAEILTLMHAENPWVKKYLRWKSLNTLCTNYLEKWVEVVHNDRLHGRFDQARTETGRIASRDPNMQAIPVSMGFNVRTLMRAPMMIGDYSGLDARVAAHFSEDPLLLQIFRDNLDLYGTMAASAWGGSADKKNPNRSLMKILYLSAQYGAAAKSIGDKMRIAGIDEKLCRQSGKLLRNMEETVPRMYEWREEVLREAMANGYVMTITGRKRFLPDLYSDEWWRRTRAERQCVASQVQGTSADIVRRAMIKVREAVSPEQATMILQVHDEILWQRGPAWTDDLFDEIVNICETAHEHDFYVPSTGDTLPGFPLKIPMNFSASLGESWEEKDAQGARSYRVMA